MTRFLLVFAVAASVAQVAHAAAETRYFVAALPTCSGSTGVKYVARDALAPVKGQQVAGLGQRAVRVICQGGAWIVKDK